MYIVVTGAPGSGKTSLAQRLGPAFGLPVLGKDTIKAALVEVLGADTVQESRRLGGAAVAALLAVAEEAGCGVLDSVWVDRPTAVARLSALPGRVVEVFCRCEPDLLRERYRERAASRGPGHFDLDRSEEELWNDSSLQPLDGGWPVVTVDTSTQLDVKAVTERIRRALSSLRTAE